MTKYEFGNVTGGNNVFGNVYGNVSNTQINHSDFEKEMKDLISSYSSGHNKEELLKALSEISDTKISEGKKSSGKNMLMKFLEGGSSKFGGIVTEKVYTYLTSLNFNPEDIQNIDPNTIT